MRSQPIRTGRIESRAFKTAEVREVEAVPKSLVHFFTSATIVCGSGNPELKISKPVFWSRLVWMQRHVESILKKSKPFGR